MTTPKPPSVAFAGCRCGRHSAWCSVSDDEYPPSPCCWDCPGSYNQARICAGAHRPTGTGWPSRGALTTTDEETTRG